jgi:hypothetical protein
MLVTDGNLQPAIFSQIFVFFFHTLTRAHLILIPICFPARKIIFLLKSVCVCVCVCMCVHVFHGMGWDKEKKQS